MEVDINPLNLTLDQVIALNKSRNNNQEFDDEPELEVNEMCDLNGFSESNPKPPIEINNVEKRLRSMPGFGSKPIHYRLGYNNWKGRRNQNLKQAIANKYLNNAKISFWKKQRQRPPNPCITFTNPDAFEKPFLSPLTKWSVNKMNQMNKFKLLGKTHGSSLSLVSSRSTFKRHSAKRCLNPRLQEEIEQLKPSMSTLDLESLEDFKPNPEATDLPTHNRFSMYI